MIIAAQWQHDGYGQHVLFAGPEPFAQVRPVPGKDQFRCTVSSPTGLRSTQFPTLEQGKAHAEQAVDALIRARLGDAAKAVLHDAGL